MSAARFFRRRKRERSSRTRQKPGGTTLREGSESQIQHDTENPEGAQALLGRSAAAIVVQTMSTPPPNSMDASTQNACTSRLPTLPCSSHCGGSDNGRAPYLQMSDRQFVCSTISQPTVLGNTRLREESTVLHSFPTAARMPRKANDWNWVGACWRLASGFVMASLRSALTKK